MFAKWCPFLLGLNKLTDCVKWGNIALPTWKNIGSGYGLLPIRWQFITETNMELVSIEHISMISSQNTYIVIPKNV